MAAPEDSFSYKCPTCKRTFEKNELKNGNLPLHVVNRIKCQNSCKAPIIDKK